MPRTLDILIYTVLLKVVTALWGLLVARNLGAEKYGEFALVLAIIAATQVFSDAGVGPYLARYIARRGRLTFTLTIRVVMVLQFTLALVSIGVLSSFLHFFTGLGLSIKLGVAMVVLVTALAQVVRGALRGQGRADLEVATQLIGYAVLFAFTVLIGEGITVGVATWMYSVWAMPVLLAGLFIRTIRPIPPRSNQPLIRMARMTWLAFCCSFSLNAIGSLGALWTRLDVLILGVFVTSSQLGNYSAAIQVYFGIISLGPPVAAALLPFFVENRFKSHVFTDGLNKWIALSTGVGALMSVVIIVFASSIASLFGPSFAAAVPIIRIVAIGIPFVLGSAILAQGLIAINSERVLLAIFATVVGFGVTTHTIGAAILGSRGVAISLVVAVILRFFAEWSTLRRRIGVDAGVSF